MTLAKAREREGVDGGEEPYAKHQRVRGNSCSIYRGCLHVSRFETEGKSQNRGSRWMKSTANLHSRTRSGVIATPGGEVGG